ncbi:MobF family relaxase [Aquimarina macrocephali]|uniref:MobF family relaxase n=1 Tax=Aquimarina macrocephali TaxID=666563 RepID=UPI0004635571|nr:MobF family relaxase [Aquimarina macrocephali]
MLSIEPSKNTAAAISYFRVNLAMNDYYSEKEQVIGQWHGNAAMKLGLSGDVKAQDFENLLHNQDPNTGDRLTARNSANRRPMYDFTFSPVKSVSVMHAITGDQDIINAHHDAVKKTMLEVETNIQTQIGTQGKGRGKEYVKTGNIAYAEFLHDTTRPTLQDLKSGKNYVPDPQLHSHCAVINATYFEKQNRWRAIEIYGVKKQSPYYEAFYHSTMRQNLKKAGYETYDTDERWEILGVDRKVIEKYSTRNEEINSFAQKEGISDPKHKAKLGRITRHDKNKSVPENELNSIWKDRLSLSEYHAIVNAKKSNGKDKTSGAISIDFNQEKATPEIKQSVQTTIAINQALQHFMERNSGIEKNRVLDYALRLTNGKVSPEEVKQNLEARDNILSATNKKGIEFITTDWMNQQEEYLIERAADSKATQPALNPNYKIDAPYFTKGQKMAVDHVLNSKDKIILVSGDAGTGKTTLLKEIQEGIKYGNKKLHMFAPSSDAAKNVLRKEGFENADTIARLLVDTKMQEQMRGGVIGIDEAGLVGVPTMNKLITIAEKQNARLLLSGDWKQHSSVEAGCGMKLIETISKVKAARVNEIVRQRHVETYKKVVEKMASAIGRKNETQRKEEMGTAFEALNKNDNIIEIKNKAARHEHVANAYLTHTKKKDDDAIIVSPSKKQGRILTDTIRQKLRDEGRIGKKDKDFYALRSKQLTAQQKQNPNNYNQGDAIEFHQYVRGFKTGLQYIVNSIDKDNVHIKSEEEENTRVLPLLNKGKFEVYNKQEIQFARKDMIRITKNTKSLEGKALHNGQNYKIKSFDWRGDIILENGATIPKTNHHIDHGYVTTSPASQGKTAKTVIVSQDKSAGKAAYDKQFYVSVSRGSENCLIYTDDKYALKDAISKSNEGMSATEIKAAKQEAERKEALRDQEIEEHQTHMNRMREYIDTHIKPAYENFKTEMNHEPEQEYKQPQHGQAGGEMEEPQPC